MISRSREVSRSFSRNKFSSLKSSRSEIPNPVGNKDRFDKRVSCKQSTSFRSFFVDLEDTANEENCFFSTEFVPWQFASSLVSVNVVASLSFTFFPVSSLLATLNAFDGGIGVGRAIAKEIPLFTRCLTFGISGKHEALMFSVSQNTRMKFPVVCS